jgi:luciferase family oxidoreductase group 1
MQHSFDGMNPIRLSILDQSLIPKGGSAVQSLQNTIILAQLAEKWGYSRFWVSEHHNLHSVAGAAPEILMARLAQETQHIRIGSGGIMLPNHSALKVAENFRLLEALYPGRIDLGLGRAPGGDRVTASMLNPSNNFSEQSYLRQLDHLQIFFKDEAGTEYGRMIAVPQIATSPEQWMLSSSGGSSKIAGKYGMGLAVARFINGQASGEMVRTYLENFVPSEQFPQPKTMLSIVVLCADTEEKANQLKKSVDYQFLQISKGNFDGIESFDAIHDYTFSPQEMDALRLHGGRVVAGTPPQVKEKLMLLAQEFQAEEMMVVAWAADFKDRIRSFELLAKAFGLEKEIKDPSLKVEVGST